ncbi:MAG: mannose-1-phosphate guanylyltransferase [Candidatus Omnitrophica bacterium]|nr:mannose-1-phosphate guanylyltransferase [Candidatus Omnitrophota bacterium]
MIYSVILSGGVGSRFWPLSRSSQPKQFLNLCSNKPMIEQTILRLKPLVSKNNFYIATNKLYSNKIKSLLKKTGIPLQNALFEPQSRNTFPPIVVLSKVVYEKDKDAVMIVLPCDHYIKNETKFLSILKKAICVAKSGYIVTLGIKPERPEIGYGYIKVNKKLKTGAFLVERFVEKPNFEKAKQYLNNKSFYWNGGIFIFKASVLLDEVKKLAKKDYKAILKVNTLNNVKMNWGKITATSIDYAVMEKTKKIALIPLDAGWSDIGSWEALESLVKKDSLGNIFRGSCIDLGSENSIVWSESKRLVATFGLENCLVVDTPDALLVCPKDKSQDVKRLVETLKQKKLNKQI